MSSRRPLPRVLALFALTLTVTGGVTGDDGPEQVEPPRQTDLLEKAESRLAQLFVTVSGPRAAAANLAAEDFSLRVNLKKTDFKLDRFCDATADDGRERPAAAGTGTAPRQPVSYLFYFDQAHLTLAGRQRSLDVTRQLIPRLIRDGNRGMIASNARRLAVIEEFTDDAPRLLAAVDRLEHDRTQWDSFAQEEKERIREIVQVLNEEQNLPRATAAARAYQREESWRSAKHLRRLSIMVARLAEVPSPKAVVYFADNLRSNAGEHYLSFFGESIRRGSMALQEMSTDVLVAALPFDQVINEASTQGVRIYTVQAEGLVTPFDEARPSPNALVLGQTVTRSSGVRYRHAQDTLSNLASETGGRPFLHGISARRIAERIVEDYACLYLISFDPAGFARDSPLRVAVKLRRDGLRHRARGRIVLQSDRARLAARLLSAFALEQPDDAGFGLRANLVPTGFEDGAYSALLQLSVPATTLPTSAWDLGASILHREAVREEVSGRIGVERPGVPLILEEELRFRPGLHEIIAVAHETTAGFVLSERFQVDWPDPRGGVELCGPIALLQPRVGAFSRAGETRSSGSLARSDSDAIRTDRPAALMGLVCRGRRNEEPLSVERSLVGERHVDFPILQVAFEEARCAQIRDLIPADSLRAGFYRYEVRVLRDGAVIDETSREFVAEAPLR